MALEVSRVWDYAQVFLDSREAVLATSSALILLGNIPPIRVRVASYVARVIGFLLLVPVSGSLSPFSRLLLLSGVTVSAFLAFYTPKYSIAKYRSLSLVPLVDLFALSILTVFTSSRLIEMITFWLIAELLGFFLIAYDYLARAEREALLAAAKYLLFSMIPTDVALFVILALAGFSEAIHLQLTELTPDLTSPLVTVLVLLGFFAKAAVAPLHFWLPDAHSIAPAPASALLSGLMVKMGIYGIYMVNSYPICRDIAVALMLLSGCLTAIYGGLQAAVQYDIKRLLAYSTTSHTATIIILLALHILSGDAAFIDAATIYSVAHVFFKSSLFMDSGFIETLTHNRDLSKLGYVYLTAPVASLAAIISVISMFGMPPAVGFLAKVVTFTSISHHLKDSWLYVLVLIVISTEVALSVVYSIKYLKAHIGSIDKPQNSSLDSKAMELAPYVVGLVAASVGFTFAIVTVYEGSYSEPGLLLEMLPVLAVALLMLTFLVTYLFELLRRVEKVGES